MKLPNTSSYLTFDTWTTTNAPSSVSGQSTEAGKGEYIVPVPEDQVTPADSPPTVSDPEEK